MADGPRNFTGEGSADDGIESEHVSQEPRSWVTFTPREFVADDSFFSRDSGLLARGLIAAGVDCRVVMPGDPSSGGDEGVVRASWVDLQDPGWWRASGADAVVYYGWGRPFEMEVLQAIRAAGLWLCMVQDSGGLMSPLCGLRPWLLERWAVGRRQRGWKRWVGFLGKVGWGLSLGLIMRDLPRVRQLRLADRIGVVSPGALTRYRIWLRRMGSGDLVGRLMLSPHPVSMACEPGEGVQRQDHVVAVGRWDDFGQKRPDRLRKLIGEVLTARETTCFSIIGRIDETMLEWHESLSGGWRERVTLHGSLDHAEIIAIYQRSRVMVCCSDFESFHISSAEALCCGMTVVSWRSPSLPSLRWFASGGSGVLAEASGMMGSCLVRELQRWDRGEPDAAGIARRWSGLCHAGAVAARMLKAFRERGGGIDAFGA
jgi:hypothetical protein